MSLISKGSFPIRNTMLSCSKSYGNDFFVFLFVVHFDEFLQAETLRILTHRTTHWFFFCLFLFIVIFFMLSVFRSLRCCGVSHDWRFFVKIKPSATHSTRGLTCAIIYVDANAIAHCRSPHTPYDSASGLSRCTNTYARTAITSTTTFSILSARLESQSIESTRWQVFWGLAKLSLPCRESHRSERIEREKKCFFFYGFI